MTQEKLVVCSYRGDEFEGAFHTDPILYESIEAFYVHHEQKCREACQVIERKLNEKKKTKECTGRFSLAGIEFEVEQYMYYDTETNKLEYLGVDVYTLDEWFKKFVKA